MASSIPAYSYASYQLAQFETQFEGKVTDGDTIHYSAYFLD